MSSCRKSCTGLRESTLGVASKYSAPRKKFLVVSLKKNCRAVAALPPTRKKTPVMPFLVVNRLSLIELVTAWFLFVRLKASLTILSK